MPKPIKLEYNGRSQSVSAWARETGLDISLLLSRLRHGWPLSEILTTPRGVGRASKPPRLPSPTERRLEHSGKTKTVAEWAIETGLSKSVIHGRLDLGWAIADVLTKPVRPRNSNGAGHKRKDMRDRISPHKRPGYRPKPLDGRCENCRCERDLHGDHDPATGQFRGWLCFHCNTGIGKLGDNVEGLREAIAYLERTTTA